ncbi:MAG: TerB N-terminal domain-containing protein [Eubacteriaceae bacterium]|nr:TerB N-terminal domain-containing protein [Eubacteriaceae bacterium]
MADKDEYSSFSIPLRKPQPIKEEPQQAEPGQEETASGLSFDDEFSEIEYEFKAGSASKNLDFIDAKPQKITQIEANPIREKFYKMRSLASDNPFARNDAKIFYHQAVYMEGFDDDYEGEAEFMMYYPYYQHMGYEQLRTYFTWRKHVRSGDIWHTSLSYIFLHIYELLSGIGVESALDGLNRIMDLWLALREYEPSLDNYLPQWLKDYHIYYELPHTFIEFIEEHSLHEFYSELLLFSDSKDQEGSLSLWNGVSSYNIKKSKFYEGNEQLLAASFHAVLDAIKKLCSSRNASIEDLFVHSTYEGISWHPFPRALFYSEKAQRDRQVEMPGKEVFYCLNNVWYANASVEHSGKRELIGYIIKKTEASVRQASKYKYKITASISPASQSIKKLKEIGIKASELESAIDAAVREYFASLSRTVVTVSLGNLERIREEAQGTQEMLVVEEEGSEANDSLSRMPVESVGEIAIENQSELGEWQALRQALSPDEIEALRIALKSPGSIKSFAISKGVMLEVLADGINEKASDIIGDSLLELDFRDQMLIYDDYEQNVIEIVG